MAFGSTVPSTDEIGTDILEKERRTGTIVLDVVMRCASDNDSFLIGRRAGPTMIKYIGRKSSSTR